MLELLLRVALIIAVIGVPVTGFPVLGVPVPGHVDSSDGAASDPSTGSAGIGILVSAKPAAESPLPVANPADATEFRRQNGSGSEPAGLPAFPGAQGFGSETPGGRGGSVRIVDSLADYHPSEKPIPGTLRWAVNRPEPRIVVFRVSGLISLEAPLWIGGTPRERPAGDNPYSFLTVAGQSAPGGGIALENYGVSLTNGVHDVVIRHLRVRNPMAYTEDPRTGRQVGDGFALEGASNVVLDHVSCAWSTDECISIEGTARRPNRDVTVQHSLAAEGLLHGGHPTTPGPHSRCVISSENSTRISIHHNLMMSCNRRHPQLGGTSRIGGDEPPLTDLRYNLVYNFGKNGIQFSGQLEGPHANIVGNLVRFGPQSTAPTAMANLDRAPVGSTVYLEGNCESRRIGRWGPDTLNCPADQATLVSGSFFTAARRPFDAPAIESEFVGGLTDGMVPYLLANVGALPHDAHDEKFLEDYRAYGGQLGGPCRDVSDNDCHDAIRVVPPASGTPAPDTDGDGMPDEWELDRGLDPFDPADAQADPDGDGYRNVEEYLNERAAALVDGQPVPSPQPGPPDDDGTTPTRPHDGGMLLDPSPDVRPDVPGPRSGDGGGDERIRFAIQFERHEEEVGRIGSYVAHPAGLPTPTHAMAYGNVFVWHSDPRQHARFLAKHMVEASRQGITGLLYTPTAIYGKALEERLADGSVPPLDELVRRPWVSVAEPGFLGSLERQRDVIARLVDEGRVTSIVLRPFQEAGHGIHDNAGLTAEGYAELIRWMVDDLYAGLPVEAVIVHWNQIDGLAEAIPDLEREIPIFSGVTVAMPSHAGMPIFAMSERRPDLEGRDFASRSWEVAGVKTWIAEFSVWDDGRVDKVTGWKATGLVDPSVIPNFFEHYRNLRESGHLGGITWLNKVGYTSRQISDPDLKDGRWDADTVHPEVRSWWIDEVTEVNGYRLGPR